MTELAGLASVQALAWALVHFLWQGALVAVAAALLFRVASRASARYAIGIGALVVMLAIPVVTFSALLDAQSGRIPAPSNAAVVADRLSSATVSADSTATARTATVDSSWWPAMGVVAWIAGMLVLSVRLAGGWLVARRMATRAVRPAADHVQAVARSLAERLALGRAVEVLESSAVAVPVLVGWLRPAVVFPVAALAGLSPVQIEALLAHELAHVRRHDYLVNLLQSLAEIVLFYHPAVWWLSRRIRTERELCCDDLAVGLCDRLVYATALTDLAAMRSPRVALAATGGDLLTRVRRILEREEAPMSNTRWIPALIVSALVIAVVPVTLASVQPAPEQAAPPVAAIAPAPVAEAIAPEAAESLELVAEAEPSQADQAAREREIEKLRQRLMELEREMMEARLLSASAEQSTERAKLAANLEQLAARQSLEEARKNLDRAQSLFEKGLTTPSQLAEARMALKLAEAGPDQRKREEVETEALEQRVAEARRRMEKGLVSQNDVSRLESELAQTRLRASANELRGRANEALERDRRSMDAAAEIGRRAAGEQVEQQRRLRDLAAEYQRQSEAYAREFAQARERSIESRARAERSEVLPERPVSRRALEPVASRPIVAGDFLFVSFEGESELPTIYRIESNGTIRVPLLGTFKVLGQTPGQVREAIGKKLMDAKLGSPAKVRVELRQPREEQERRVR